MIYVQAINNQFYGNPTIYNDRGVLKFVDGVPEIIVRSFAKTSATSGILRARTALKEMGIKVGSMKLRAAGNYNFPPTWKRYNAMYFNFSLQAPIPVPTDFETITADPPLGCTMISFCIQMPRERLIKAIDDSKDMDRTLMHLLLGVPFHEIPTMRVKDELRKLITSQYPDLKNIAYGEILMVNKGVYDEIPES